MIYTSYFAGLRYLPESIVPIAISRGVPDWFEGERYSKLAPSWELVQDYKRTGNTHFYAIRYGSALRKLDIHEVIADLNEISEGRSFALICFEKPSNFCHRHIVADWLNKNGYRCKEWRGVF